MFVFFNSSKSDAKIDAKNVKLPFCRYLYSNLTLRMPLLSLYEHLLSIKLKELKEMSNKEMSNKEMRR